MFVALDASAGSQIAAGIVGAFCDQGICPRSGLAYAKCSPYTATTTARW
jgi:hypothetical protein